VATYQIRRQLFNRVARITRLSILAVWTASTQNE
jgi:hypothetical protein